MSFWCFRAVYSAVWRHVSAYRLSAWSIWAVVFWSLYGQTSKTCEHNRLFDGIMYLRIPNMASVHLRCGWYTYIYSTLYIYIYLIRFPAAAGFNSSKLHQSHWASTQRSHIDLSCIDRPQLFPVVPKSLDVFKGLISQYWMIEIHVIGGAGGSLGRVPTRSLREAYAKPR
jgi:hypothetical protein